MSDCPCSGKFHTHDTADHDTAPGQAALSEDEGLLLARWVDSLWTTTCAHGGGYARDCYRCIHETLYRSEWLAVHDARTTAPGTEASDALRDAADAMSQHSADNARAFADLLRARADSLDPRIVREQGQGEGGGGRG